MYIRAIILYCKMNETLGLLCVFGLITLSEKTTMGLLHATCKHYEMKNSNEIRISNVHIKNHHRCKSARITTKMKYRFT